MDDDWNHGGTMSENNGVKYTVEPSELRRSGNFEVGVLPNRTAV